MKENRLGTHAVWLCVILDLILNLGCLCVCECVCACVKGLCSHPQQSAVEAALTVVYLPSWQSEGKVSW